MLSKKDNIQLNLTTSTLSGNDLVMQTQEATTQQELQLDNTIKIVYHLT